MEKGINKVFADDITITEIEDMFKSNTDLITKFKDFQEFMMMYKCAIREVRTKFEVLSDDFSVTYKRNPIEIIKSRIKKPVSILGKLERKNLPMTMDSILNNLQGY